MFPTFTPKCTLMLTGGLFPEIRLDYYQIISIMRLLDYQLFSDQNSLQGGQKY